MMQEFTLTYRDVSIGGYRKLLYDVFRWDTGFSKMTFHLLGCSPIRSIRGGYLNGMIFRFV